ncbi:hypothetical protein R80B4_02261 [Fibrobacteres bacterium R8-0-B4]
MVGRGAKEVEVLENVGVPTEAGADEEAMNTKGVGKGAKDGVDVGGDGVGGKGID